MQIAVVECLTSLPSLESLDIRIRDGSANHLPLGQILGLRKLCISASRQDLHSHLAGHLRQVIGNSSHLTHLDLRTFGWPSNHNDTLAVSDLLSGISRGQPLRLTCLELDGWPTTLKPCVLPHLRSLISLKFVNGWERASDLLTFEIDEIPANPRAGEVWEVLRTAAIFIPEIIVDVVDDAQLIYLDSHPGIKKLTLLGAGDSESSDLLATKFYGTILPKHVHTLESLTIKAAFEGNWCFGKHNFAVLARCRRLVELKMSYMSPHVNYETPNLENTVVVSVVNQFSTATTGSLICTGQGTLLDVATRLPRLRRLAILHAPPASHRIPWFGNGLIGIRRRQYVTSVLRRILTSFGPIDPLTHPPIVDIVTEMDVTRFRIRLDEEAGVQRYCPDEDSLPAEHW